MNNTSTRARRRARSSVAAAAAITVIGALSAVADSGVASADPASGREPTSSGAVCAPTAPYTVCRTFSYTGSDQTFTVPEGVTTIGAAVSGAGGGRATWDSSNGGAGGAASGVLPVGGGQDLVLSVGGIGANGSGGAGTYGGGGAGGSGSRGSGGAGGGLSAIWSAGAFTSRPVLLAGGGGGAGGAGAPATSGGAGGGASGVTGSSQSDSTGGSGGTQTAGGRGGSGGDTLAGSAGSKYLGGAAGAGADGGGGGGAGYFGGGGGAGQSRTTSENNDGGGGGGSSFVDASVVVGGTTTSGGGSAAGRTGSVTLQWAEHPAVEVAFSGVRTDLDGDGRASAGDQVRYTATVRNTGDTVLSAGALTDDLGTGLACPPSVGLGDTVDCVSGTPHVLTQADIDSGALTDTVTFAGTTASGASFSVAPVQTTLPLAADASGSTTTAIAEQDAVVGDDLHVTTTVANTGNVTLRDVAITVNGSSAPCDATSVAPGAELTCGVTRTVTQDDVDAGGVVFATAGTAGTPAGDAVVLDASAASLGIVAVPGSDLDLSTTVTGPSEPGVGDEIGLAVSLQNAGNVTLRDPSVEIAGQDGMRARCAGPIAPGTTIDCTVTGTHRVTQADVDTGSTSFSATSSATAPGGDEVRSEAHASRSTEAQVPALGTSLTVTPPDHRHPAAGDEVAVETTVSNEGNVTLHDLTVVAAPTATVDCPRDELGPGESTTCQVAAHRLSQADVDAGVVLFETAVSATGPHDQHVEAADRHSMTIDRLDAVSADVTTTIAHDGDGPIAAGTPVAVEVVVTNDGTTSLRGFGITTSSHTRAAVACPSGVLEPGETATCDIPDLVVQQADVDRGSVDAEVTVSASSPSGTIEHRATSSTPVARAAQVDAAVSAHLAASPHDVPVAGDVVEAAASVANTGNVTLTTVGLELDGVPVACAPVELAPGASADCAIEDHVLSQAEVDAGSIAFPVTAAATGPDGSVVEAAASVTVALDARNGLDLAAEWNASARGTLHPGDTVDAEYRVVNTSNRSLDTVDVRDDRAGEVECDVTHLAPGEATTCRPERAVTVGDRDATAGVLRFAAEASARAPQDAVVESDRASTTFAVEPTPVPAPVLAFTGSELVRTALPIGGLLVLAGLGLAGVLRRRSRDSA